MKRMNFKGVCLVVLTSLVIGGCNYSKTELKKVLNQTLEENALEHGIPAQSLMVLRNESVLFSGGKGNSKVNNKALIDENSVFPIFSVTKLFASTLVFQLIEDGQLSLSDPISKHLTKIPEHWRKIRLEQLLNHTSGLPEYFQCRDQQCDFPESAEIGIQSLKDVPLTFNPDSQMRYNQTNYLLLKLIIESATQTSYKELIANRILKPIGLNNTWLSINEVPKDRLIKSYHAGLGEPLKENETKFPEYAISQADMYSTAGDLSRFLSMIIRGKLVTKEQLFQHWSPYVLSNGDEGFFANGWEYDSAGSWHAVGHDGGAVVRVRILFKDDLNDHFIIVYLTNGNEDGVWTRTLVESVQYYVLPDIWSKLVSRF